MSLLQLTVKHNLFRAQQLVLISKMLEACGPCYVFSQDSKIHLHIHYIVEADTCFQLTQRELTLMGGPASMGGPAFMGGSVSTADMSSLVVSLCGWTCLYGSTYLYGWDCLYGWAISNAEHVLEAMEQLKLQP